MSASNEALPHIYAFNAQSVYSRRSQFRQWQFNFTYFLRSVSFLVFLFSECASILATATEQAAKSTFVESISIEIPRTSFINNNKRIERSGSVTCKSRAPFNTPTRHKTVNKRIENLLFGLASHVISFRARSPPTPLPNELREGSGE